MKRACDLVKDLELACWGEQGIWEAEAAEFLEAVQRDALETAARTAKVAWLYYPRSELGDADHDNDLCEFTELKIRDLIPTDATVMP